MNAFIVMSYETVRIKSPFIQFFIPLYSGGGLWVFGFFFFFFQGFQESCSQFVTGQYQTSFSEHFCSKIGKIYRDK